MGRMLTVVENMKRKVPHTSNEDSLAKRLMQQTSQHAQHAGQNSVLASMLKQTTMASPSVPTTMACTMVSEFCEEKLPKNLKVHTSYSGTSTSNQLDISSNQNTVSQDASVFSDSWLSFLMDDVCNMEEEYKMSRQEYLPDVAINIKMASAEEAIKYIKRQLVSCESSVLTESPLINMIRLMDTIAEPSVVLQQKLVVPDSLSQANQIPISPLSTCLGANNSTERIKSSGLHSPSNNFNRDRSYSQINNGQGSPQYQTQYLNVPEPPKKRKQIIKGQQKRMAARQQQKSQIPKPIRVQLPFITKQGKIKYIVPNQQSRAFALSPDENNNLLDITVASKIRYQPYPRKPQRQMDLKYNVHQSMNISAPPQKSPVQQSTYPPSEQYHQTRSVSPQPCSQAFVQQMRQKESQNTQSGHQQNQLLQDQYSDQQQLLASQQGHQMALHYMPSPGLQNSLNSHFQPPPSGMAFYQQQHNSAMVQQPPLAQAPQQNMQRMVSILKQRNFTPSPVGFAKSDPIYSPQSSPGNFTPPVSSCNTSMPMSHSSNFSRENVFHNQQMYPVSMIDRNHCNGGYYVTSPEPCQDLPSILGQRTQQHQSSLKLYESHPFQNQGYQEMGEQMAAF